MVTLTIEPDPVMDSFSWLEGVPPVLTEVKCKGLVPPHLFERLIRCGARWYLDLSLATSVETIHWSFADIYANCQIVFNERGTVILAGVPVNQHELHDLLWSFCYDYGILPHITDVRTGFIALGLPDVETEDFWFDLTYDHNDEESWSEHRDDSDEADFE